MTVYASTLGVLWRMLESYDVDPSGVIPARHYRPGMITTSATRIRFEEYDAIQARALSLIRDPAAGIRSARFLHPSHLGALGHVLLSSSSLRTALKRVVRYSRMFHDHVDISLEESSDWLKIIYSMRKKPTRPGHVGDAQVAGVLTLLRLNAGEGLTPKEVTFRRPKPTDPSPWLDFFKTDVKFGQPLISVSFGIEDVDRTLTSSDPELVALHEDVIQRYLLKHDRSNVLNQARLRIMEQLPSGPVTEDETAAALNMSKRTLHRKLREYDETFRSLLTQVRTDMASRYIVNADYSVTDIAFLLGYTDTSAFSRAFRSWYGHSPTDERLRLRSA